MAPAQRVGSGDERPSVLLVDDRPSNLVSLEAILEPLDAHLVRASSAEEALEAVKRREFAVILLDVQMPGMDGYEVARRIKALEAPRLTPVIFLTALNEDRRRVHAGYASGAVDYLFKPLDPDVLFAKVQAFVRMYAERDAAERLARRRYADLAQQEAERASERRASTILESITDAFYALDADFRFTYVNRRAEELWGRRRDELVGKLYLAEFPQAMDSASYEMHRRAMTERKPLRYETVSPILGRWIAVSLYPEASGGLSCYFQDISERKAAEAERERLLEAERVARERAEAVERRLAEIFELAPAFIAVLRGPEHVFELANKAYYQIVGHRDIIGKPAREAVPEAQDQGFVELLDRVRRSGRPFIGNEIPILLVRAPGARAEERFLDFVYQPLNDVSGAPTGIFVHGVDVTDQVRSRTEVEQARADAEEARARAERANTVKSHFLATMSHELRTPLNAQIGYAQLLEMGLAGPLTEEQHRYVERLTQSSGHLLSLINDVLDFSKIEAGELSAHREDAWTGPLAEEALDLIRPQATSRGVELKDERPSEAGVPFVGDEQRARQILVNLLSNAVKFTDRGGQVTISCGLADNAPPFVQVHGEGPWAFVRVEDTGIGIEPEQLVHIFDPFHQVDSTHTRQQGGTGLGLAISRRLARLMGGDLTAESTPHEGSAFTLWLPSVHRELPSGRAEAPAAERETAEERAARAEHPAAGMETPGLAEIGELLRGILDEVLVAYTERLRADPAVPRARRLRRPELEDHQLSFLADLAQTLLVVSEAGSRASELLQDGSAIQHAIADHHGARRHAQGWTEAAVRRDHQILREELARAVRSRIRARSRTGLGPNVEEALHMVLHLVDHAEAVSVSAWRRAAKGDAVVEPAGGPASGRSPAADDRT
jgi:PAS domain S-box-containing protein